jgi:hypothetical protein
MQDGQATLEYTAAIAVVALVLALGGLAVAGHGGAIADAVGGGIRRGLCVVLGGDCFGAAPRPCVIGTAEHRRDAQASLMVFRLADGRSVLREVHSDGTVAVTVVQGQRLGAALTFGGVATVNGHGLKTGGEARVDGRGAYTRTWVTPDAGAADRLVAQLAEDDVPAGGVTVALARLATGHGEGGPPPESRALELGVGGHAEAALRALGLGARAELLGGATIGVRVSRGGERAVLLRTDGELGAALTAPVAQLSGGMPSHTGVELVFDRDGDPVTLTVRAVRGVRGVAQLGPYALRGGDRAEVEARLDLTDTEARALADRLVRGVGSVSGDALDAAHALAARLAERARLDVRLLATDRAEQTSGATVGLGGKLGVEIVRIDESARLVAAAGREPGLGWRKRLDCLV